jgi:hypothetical protein
MSYKVFTLADLRALLAPLSTVRRASVLYTLDSHGTLEDTVMLSWKDALRNHHTEFTRDIVRSQPRHLRLDYVFWEYLDGGMAVPLFGLEDNVRELTMGRSFPDLQALYDRMIWVDTNAEAADFGRALSGAMEER